MNRGPCLLPGDVITKDDVFDVMEEDLAAADMVLWVGISFEQSASTSYFRRVSPRRSSCSHHETQRPLRVTPQNAVPTALPTAFCSLHRLGSCSQNRRRDA